MAPSQCQGCDRQIALEMGQESFPVFKAIDRTGTCGCGAVVDQDGGEQAMAERITHFSRI
jgi:hypothetical protein